MKKWRRYGQYSNTSCHWDNESGDNKEKVAIEENSIKKLEMIKKSHNDKINGIAEKFL